jgi:NADH:ubiquinone reductase (non-electrogenic)
MDPRTGRLAVGPTLAVLLAATRGSRVAAAPEGAAGGGGLGVGGGIGGPQGVFGLADPGRPPSRRNPPTVFALGDAASASSSSSSSSSPSSSASSSSASSAAAAAAAGAGAPFLPATAQVAFQQAEYAAWNVWSSLRGSRPLAFQFLPLGEMMTFGPADAAVVLPLPFAASAAPPSAQQAAQQAAPAFTLRGPLGALARRAVYAARMPSSTPP